MYDDKPKILACGANGGHLENDVIEIMKTIQWELKKRGYQAVVVGLIKDKSFENIDLTNIFN